MQKLIVNSYSSFRIGQAEFVYDKLTDTIYSENGQPISPDELNIVGYEDETPIWSEDWATLSTELSKNNGKFVYLG